MAGGDVPQSSTVVTSACRYSFAGRFPLLCKLPLSNPKHNLRTGLYSTTTCLPYRLTPKRYRRLSRLVVFAPPEREDAHLRRRGVAGSLFLRLTYGKESVGSSSLVRRSDRAQSRQMRSPGLSALKQFTMTMAAMTRRTPTTMSVILPPLDNGIGASSSTFGVGRSASTGFVAKKPSGVLCQRRYAKEAGGTVRGRGLLYADGVLLDRLGQNLLDRQYDQQSGEEEGDGLTHTCLLLALPLGGRAAGYGKLRLPHERISRKPKRYSTAS